MKIQTFARHALMAALPFGFVLALLFPAIAAPVASDQPLGPCSAQWCQNGGDNPYMEREYAAMIQAQLDEHGCDTTPRLVDRVAVRDAEGFDSGVVRVVTFDAAWDAAQAGQVYVVGWCGD